MILNQPLKDTDPMPFGKHKGRMMQEVPPEYLHYLWNNGLKYEDSPVAGYIKNNLDALAMENEDLIWD